MLNVVFSIDTEPSIAGFFNNPNHTPMLDAPVSGMVNGQSEALGFLIRLFKQHEFTATFFIETAHNSYFSVDAMGKYVDELLEAHQDIQLHLHPVWHTFKDNIFTSDNSSDHSPEFMADLMYKGKELIQNWTGKAPTALRTGRFSVGKNVYHAMNMADLQISSNICLACFEPSEPELHLTHDIHTISNVTEIPATCFYDQNILNRHKGLRPLQITAVSSKEMIYVLDQMEKTGHQIAMIVTHPFEFLKYNDYRFKNMRVNKLVQKRAQILCDYLSKNKDRFKVIPISQATHILPNQTLNTPVGHGGLAFLRMAENIFNDYIL